MNCDCYTELWSKYCENDLDPETREKLEEHLSSCRVCAEGMSAFRRTLEALKDLPRLEVSPSFDAKLARAIAEERLAESDAWYRKVARAGLRFAPAAAAVAAVFVVSLLLAIRLVPVGDDAREPWQGLTAERTSAPERLPVVLSGRTQVRVEPWSVAGEWPRSLADSTMSNYRMRFVLDRVILEGEDAARASVPEGEQEVRAQYVTF